MNIPLARAFIFDLDGTIVDNMSYHGESWRSIAWELETTLTEEEFHRRFFGKTNTETIRELAGGHIADDRVRTLASHKEMLYRELYCPHLRPVDGLIEFLTRAEQAGIQLAVATSAPCSNIEFVLGGLQIQPFFQVVVRGDDFERGKPDPEVFLTAAHRLAVAPGRCVVFEDSLAGLEAARRAGMRLVALSTTFDPAELAVSPYVEHVLRDFTGLDPGTIAAS